MAMTMTRKRFELTPYEETFRKDDGGEGSRRKFADSGAVNANDGRKPIFECECGAKLVWVKSTRTGKNYLAECFPYANLTDSAFAGTSYFYVKASPHTTENHDRRIVERDELARFADEVNCKHFPENYRPYDMSGKDDGPCVHCGVTIVSDGPDYDGNPTWVAV